MEDPPIRILIVDDEPSLGEICQIFLEEMGGFSCDTVTSGAAALEQVSTSPYDAIVSDYQMPGMNGIELLKEIRGSGMDIPFIIFTGKGREAVVIEALNSGADFYLQKGGDPEALFIELASKIRQAVQRKRAEEALVRTRFSIEHSPEEYYWIDPDGYLLDVNEQSCSSLGYTREELPRLRVMDVDALYGEDEWRALWQRLKEERHLRIESAHRKKDGTVYPVEVSLAHHRMGDKEFMCAFAHDISGKKKAQEAARLSDVMNQAIFQTSGEATAVFNEDTIIVMANREFERLSGYPACELVGKRSWTEFVVEEDRERLLEYHRLRGVPGGSVPRCYEFRVVDRYGTVRSYSAVVDMIPGTTLRIASYLDITERKQAEEAIRKSEENLRSFMNALPEPALLLSADGVVLAANDAMVEAFGRREGATVGGPLHDLFPKAFTVLKLPLERAIREKRFVDEECSFEGRYVNVKICPVTDADGDVQSLAVYGMDVTDQNNTRDALKKASKKLNLLSGITRHDMLNQITVALGSLSLASRQIPDEEVRAQIERAHTAVVNIQKGLVFAKDYQDMGMKAPAWQRLDEVVKAAASIPLEGVLLDVQTAAVEVFADPMLQRVFANLLDNAVRHGERVTAIRISFHEQDDRSGVIVVEDNGIGIPEALKERIFESGYGRHTGHGLFLVREILDITGISIAETGEEGKGARFVIAAPPGGYRPASECPGVAPPIAPQT
ncbi:PAS domain S-box protein [Methanofollis tationis]|uniref:histidine kinase n=1 Tax=Methanofollis tationis TaxID=81417 RepID=A0A7K4HMC8_9EURY|nr:PAS domain S-box protein [Methanofollis tationis]